MRIDSQKPPVCLCFWVSFRGRLKYLLLDMLGLVSLLMAALSVFFVAGFVELPIWPGISLGLLSILTSVVHLRRTRQNETAAASRKTAWTALVIGGLSAASGLLIYLGLLVWASGGR